ncbi:MAG: S9 family peptidase [Deltaproteobacteria bacterium]|nr:S9 family peptidase [Deltaproteobacteria bacterium]
MTKKVAAYGSWSSPVSAEQVAAGAVRVGGVAFDGHDPYWIEARPAEGGRHVVARVGDHGWPEDATPPGFDVRSRVHGRGGGAFAVHNKTVYFCNDDDQRLYRLVRGREPEPMTPAGPFRYADLTVDAGRRRLLCVREDHSDEAAGVTNTLVAIALDGKQPPVAIVSGHDFFSTPRLSPDGTRLCWLAWDHPHLPFEHTMLFQAKLDDAGLPTDIEQIAGGEPEAVFQPSWSPDGVLTFVTDRSGWWNIYQRRDGELCNVCPLEAELGQPHWWFDMSTYGFAAEGRIVAARCDAGRWKLGTIDIAAKRFEPLAVPYDTLGHVKVAEGRVLLAGGCATEPESVALLDLATGGIEVVFRGAKIGADTKASLSEPEAIAFPTSGGSEAQPVAHAFYYAPLNKDFAGPEGAKPPLVVLCHGRPTAAARTTLDLRIQYWTSRGFAVADVNYRGSTGYGRDYRHALRGERGVVDVDDCCACAEHLVREGRVDGRRLAFSGAGAGAYTVLAALTFRNVFKAGASHYGVSDPVGAIAQAHKFESRYDQYLFGTEPTTLRARSPILHVDKLSCPVVFFHGKEDKVVPPYQAEMMVKMLKRKKVPTAYVPFEREQHGFRRAASVKRAIEGELYFYGAVLGIELADKIEPIEIGG